MSRQAASEIERTAEPPPSLLDPLDVGVLASLALAVVAFFPGVLGGSSLVPWDVLRVYPPWSQAPPKVNNLLLSDPVRLYAPWRTLLSEALRHGRLPFWDPYVFGGAPFAANSQAAIFYPPNLLYGILSVGPATTILALLHVFICAAGVYALGRLSGLRLSRPAAALAAVGCAFSGFSILWIEFPTFMATFAWIPWSLLFVLLLLEGPTRRRFAGLAVVTGLGALGGHPQLWLYGLLATGPFIGVMALHRGWAAGTSRALPRPALAVAAVALGIALAAPQLLATLEAGPLIVRGQEAFNHLTYAAFPGWLLPLVALPRVFGDSQAATWRGPANEVEMVAFCGVVTLLLAPLALARWRRPEVQALIGLEILGWGIATGSPILWLLYHVVPQMSHLRGVSRGTSLHAVALPLLAGVGLDVLARWVAQRRRAALTWIAGAVAATALLAWAIPALGTRATAATVPAQEWALLVPALTAVVLVTVATGFRGRPWSWAAGLLPLLVFGEAALAYGGFNTADPGPPALGERTRVTSFLQDHPGRFMAYGNEEVTGNTPIAYHLSTLMGSDSFILRDFADLFDVIENRPQSLFLNEAPPLLKKRSLTSPLLGVMGVRWIVTRDNGLPRRPGEVDLPPDRILPSTGAQPPLRFLDCLVHLPSEEAVLERVDSVPGDIVRIGITADDVPTGVGCTQQRGVPSPAGAELPWQSQVGSDGGIVADTAATRSRPLLYSETHYPGWRVTIDGATAPLLRIDHALLGVVVPPGRHRVHFFYQPRTLLPGVALFAAAALGLVALLALPLRGRRAGPSPGRSPG